MVVFTGSTALSGAETLAKLFEEENLVAVSGLEPPTYGL